MLPLLSEQTEEIDCTPIEQRVVMAHIGGISRILFSMGVHPYWVIMGPFLAICAIVVVILIITDEPIAPSV